MNITIEELSKVDIRIGTVESAERVEGSEKLLKLVFDFGEFGKRQILSGIGQWFTPEDLVGKQMPVFVNLEPRKMMGLESQGMLMATDGENGPVMLHPASQVPSGSKIR